MTCWPPLELRGELVAALRSSRRTHSRTRSLTDSGRVPRSNSVRVGRTTVTESSGKPPVCLHARETASSGDALPRSRVFPTESCMPKDRTYRLAIFLLKEGLASPDHAVDATNAQRELVSCGTTAATLYYKQAHPQPPRWAKFFTGDPVHANLEALRVASNGAVMLVPA